MFASKITQDVTLQSDPSVVVTIRKLSWTQIAGAKTASQIKASKNLVEMGGAAFFRAFKEMQEPSAADTPEKAPDPLLTHDHLTVLVSGIKRWTRPEPVTKEAIEDLDEPDAAALVRAILALSYPPTPTEDEEKNGVGAFTGTSTVTAATH